MDSTTTATTTNPPEGQISQAGPTEKPSGPRPRENPHQSRWGFHPCTYDDYVALRRLNYLYLRTKMRLAAWKRWDRKQPQNRVIVPAIRDARRRIIGYDTQRATPMNPPALPDFFIDGGADAGQARTVKFPWIPILYGIAAVPRPIPMGSFPATDGQTIEIATLIAERHRVEVRPLYARLRSLRGQYGRESSTVVAAANEVAELRNKIAADMVGKFTMFDVASMNRVRGLVTTLGSWYRGR